MAKLVLPVDEFKNEILECVRRQRVTIIQGDTGCGKSSRIPIMLLGAPPPDANMAKSKMFISVPRRIAAKALVERLRAVEPEYRDEIALRMGHGVKEYDSSRTRAWFVTTGYLVRLLANHPEHFNGMSHLVVDEIHERSVDTDILCLLCRRLLQTNPNIRLVLMSATLAASMYQGYFGIPEPPIKVGARRFPVEEVFLEDVIRKHRFPINLQKKLRSLAEESCKLQCKQAPSASYMEKLYPVVAHLATTVGKPESSVLIFVPGMSDILSLTELVEDIEATDVVYKCIPIHSDIPFEDQMHVFDEAVENEVRIVIATNAAESSLTLPDVDHVICLGLCKQIIYNEASHRQLLTQSWISRASATQRAGRTGRLRPGTVYRMYSKRDFTDSMLDFEPGEILRTPLDSVILMLKEMLGDENTTDVLSDCIEPPDTSAVEASYRSLHQLHFLSSPDDVGHITELGLFSCSLGVDLALCSFIGLAIQFGVGAEAIQMAAILSFPKSPWIMSNPLIHGPSNFNETVATTFASKCQLDAQLFSDPFGQMNLLSEFANTDASARHRWCKQHGVFLPRIKRLEATYENLRRRVAAYLHLDDEQLRLKASPKQMPEGKLAVLRVIQVWAFHESLIQCDASSGPRSQAGGKHIIKLSNHSGRIEQGHFNGILHSKRHPFHISGYSEVKQVGTFHLSNFPTPKNFLCSFEPKCLSYCSEKHVKLSWVSLPENLVLYISEDLFESPEFQNVALNFAAKPSVLLASQDPLKKRRGLAERSCGCWDIHGISDASCPTGGRSILWYKFERSFDKPKKQKNFVVSMRNDIKASCSAAETKNISFEFPWKHSKGKGKSEFKATSCWDDNGISNLDLKDLLGSPNVESSFDRNQGEQSIVFADQPIRNDREALVECIPEGARLLSVLASSRRRDHSILLPDLSDTSNSDETAGGAPRKEEEKVNAVKLPAHTMISKRWKRFNTNKVVYVEENSVVSSAFPVDPSETLYCCAANTMEVRGGGIRAEGLTMLPPGRLFLLLCRLSMGLFNEDHLEDGSIYDMSVSWTDPMANKKKKAKIANRVRDAIQLHQSSLALHETLHCFPDKTRELLKVFDGVNNRRVEEWEGLQADPFIHQTDEYKRRQQSRQREYGSSEKVRQKSSKTVVVPKIDKKNKKKNKQKNKKNKSKVATKL